MNLKTKVLRIHKITNISILGALSAILGWIDKLISQVIFPMLPGVKIGIANLVVLILIREREYKNTLLVVILKSIMLCLIFGSITSFIIGGTASLLSYISMLLITKIDKGNNINLGVSITGGLTHTISQILVIKFIYKMADEIYLYALPLLFMSFITSIITGITAIKLKKQLKYVNLQYLDI